MVSPDFVMPSAFASRAIARCRACSAACSGPNIAVSALRSSFSLIPRTPREPSSWGWAHAAVAPALRTPQTINSATQLSLDADPRVTWPPYAERPTPRIRIQPQAILRGESLRPAQRGCRRGSARAGHRLPAHRLELQGTGEPGEPRCLLVPR